MPNDLKLNKAKLVLSDETVYDGFSFGYEGNCDGEVVFNTGLVGYPESLTDPSYEGQILVYTYPLIGNYGVPDKNFWEGERIHARGVVVAAYQDVVSHWQSKQTLRQWLIKERVPALTGIDTRSLTKKLRQHGVMLGRIMITTKKSAVDIIDPN